MAEAMNVDEKGLASRTFADVIRRTRDNFPDERYRPRLLVARTVNEQYGIDAGRHLIAANADGTGTKPKLAERLADWNGDPRFYEGLAFDVSAMIADDAARNGYLVPAVINCLDVNSAENPAFVGALARGMERACEKGRFALMNGETAELGYRSPGWGAQRLNWNAVALTIINQEKIIDGRGLKPGQPVVALRETSIRSNGLTRARSIVEAAYMQREFGTKMRMDALVALIRSKVGTVSDDDIRAILQSLPGGSHTLDHLHLPWHEYFPDVTEELLKPSTIYAPLIHDAQGGVDGDIRVPIIACAHVSGGGVPLKAGRMLEKRGVGIHVDPVFPDPPAVTKLLELSGTYMRPDGQPFVTDRTACDQWNRGVGFLCVVPDEGAARAFVELAGSLGYEATVAGATIEKPVVEWRGHEWPVS
jgi:phosphoribosylformylglycinamidine cyclo-ligase